MKLAAYFCRNPAHRRNEQLTDCGRIRVVRALCVCVCRQKQFVAKTTRYMMCCMYRYVKLWPSAYRDTGNLVLLRNCTCSSNRYIILLLIADVKWNMQLLQRNCLFLCIVLKMFCLLPFVLFVPIHCSELCKKHCKANMKYLLLGFSINVHCVCYLYH